MIIIKTAADLQHYLCREKELEHTIGFVPTMGALHAGHIHLVNQTRKNHDILLCSIFVNPTQFNNKKDFDKYPVTIEKDINMLEAAGCDILFLPSVEEMYPTGEVPVHYDLGYLENILEGAFRPGHFQGVCRIVDKLLTLTKPDTLTLGQKDYQQCLVIKKMMALRNHNCKLEICNTVREENGLARSSRNMRLSTDEKSVAANIYKTLLRLKENIQPANIGKTQEDAIGQLSVEGLKVDYVAIADATTLLPVTEWDGNSKLIALAAASVSEVRLIDNLLIN